VASDGAAIYSRPDFDSEVIDTLNAGTKIPVSTRQFMGQGGMGLFHKIKTPRGKLGYIPDTDVILPKGTKIETPKNALSRLTEKEKKDREKTVRVEKDEDLMRKSVYLTRYVGGTIGLVDYTEKFEGNKLHSATYFAGFRLTGPNILFKSPPLDFNILATPLMPKYLSDVGSGAHGFLLMSDLAMNMPLYEELNSLIYYNLGLLLNFSDYKVDVGTGSYDSMDLRIGVDIGAGYAYRFSSYVLRADLKYYIEKTLYFGAMISFQTEY
jgi:hypothetical protein